MNPNKWKDCFILTFAEGAEPGEPIPLTRQATRKLGEAPHVVTALSESYGSRLGRPVLWEGSIFLQLGPPESPLDELPEDTLRDLRVASAQLVQNAEGPALPLQLAISHRHCIEPLRAIAHARERAEFSVELRVGDERERFLTIEPKHFSEKQVEQDEIQRIRSPIDMVGRSTQDGAVVLLRNSARLHLPFEHYPMTSHELLERIEEQETVFIGMASTIKRNTFVALPGGELLTQQALAV